MEQYIKDIAGMILEDQCIIICGSELSAIANEKFSNKKIVENFVKEYKDDLPKTHDEDNFLRMSLPEIVQLYINNLNLAENEIQSKVDEIADRISINFLRSHIELDENPSTTHMILVNLGCRDIYTTNYDALIEEAYHKVGFPNNSINVISEDHQFHLINRKGFPNVYKLCGTAGLRNITLVQSQFKNRNLSRLHYPFMRQILRKTIVFIGYNENDNITLSPYVNFIMSCHPGKCYCVTPPSSSSPSELNKIAGITNIPMEIGEFISQLYIALLSYTSDCFDYFSEKRKFIEKFAIALLKQGITNIDAQNVSVVGKSLEEHRTQYNTAQSLGNTWFYDYSFHRSLYEILPKKIFAKEFSELYLKLRIFYSTYQISSTLSEHTEIYENLSVQSPDIDNSLVKHLDNATKTASFWLQYFNIVVNNNVLTEALRDYKTPLNSNRGQLDESILRRHKKILILGASNTGKTTYSIRQVVLSIATGSEIPIYINFDSFSLRTRALEILIHQDKFTEFLLKYFEFLELSSDSMKWIVDERLKSGKLVLIVDGFERLRSELALDFATRIRSYLSEVKKMKIIVTSRSEFMGDEESNLILSDIIGINEIFILGSVEQLTMAKKNELNSKENTKTNMTPYSSNTMPRVDVGIITIKEEEYSSLCDRLNEPTVLDGKEKRYRFAELENGNTVAVTRCTEQGNLEAQDIARCMLDDLHPQWILVVGIAGGLPNAEFSLGDVIVSSSIYDLTIEEAAQDGRRAYDIKSAELHDNAKRVVQDLPGLLTTDLSKWNDSVPRPSFDLSKIQDSTNGDAEWKDKVARSLHSNFSRDRKPHAITGKIAASDRLIKDYLIPSQWKEVARKIIAVEMESAGVYRAARKYPILTIRGISDIVGLKREVVWTQYACDTAAAFAISLVESGALFMSSDLTVE